MFRGCYQNKINGNVFFVNSNHDNFINVSPVICDKRGCMIKVLDTTKKIKTKYFKKYYHCGNYTKDIINK